MRKKEMMKIERWFDGEGPENAALHGSDESKAYAAYLAKVRQGVEARKAAPEIRDEQFSAFMAGIRENVEPAHGHRAGRRSFWALASLATASLLVALSAFVIFAGGSKEVAARTVVEEYSTELEGATVDVETDSNGATVWIKVTTEDLL